MRLLTTRRTQRRLLRSRSLKNKYLKLACMAVGVDLPDEKAFRTTWLQQIYQEVKVQVDADLAYLLVS
jgi:hypothetical protein